MNNYHWHGVVEDLRVRLCQQLLFSVPASPVQEQTTDVDACQGRGETSWVS